MLCILFPRTEINWRLPGHTINKCPLFVHLFTQKRCVECWACFMSILPFSATNNVKIVPWERSTREGINKNICFYFHIFARQLARKTTLTAKRTHPKHYVNLGIFPNFVSSNRLHTVGVTKQNLHMSLSDACQSKYVSFGLDTENKKSESLLTHILIT